MRRRRRFEDSSLELLLDTICNTFGGILFLAMLVSLLLTQTRRRTEADSSSATPRPALAPTEVSRLERRIETLRDEIRNVESLLADLRDFVPRFSSPAVEGLSKSLVSAEASTVMLETRRAEILTATADAQASAARAAAKAAAAERRLAEARAASEAAERRLETARREQAELQRSLSILEAERRAAETVTLSGRAPRERPTRKREYGLMLKYGRLYQMHRYTPADRTVNVADFIVEEGEEFNRARPRPSRGVDLSARNALDEVADLLRSFPPDRWHTCLVVHPDSFHEFLALKAWLVAHGYEYRVLPTAEAVVDRGEDDARVQ